MKIKTRVLLQTLVASLVLTFVLGAVFFLSVAGIRKMVLANSNDLGDSAAGVGAYALEVQLTEKINRIAQDIAFLLDERLEKIENYTRTTADIVGSIYSSRQSWRPKALPRVLAGEVPPLEPYVYLVPGIDYSRIQNEIELVGNIDEMLRQITVVDMGIATSAIGGESGYVIAMDNSPWPSADYDPRSFDFYKKAVEAGDLYWADVFEDHRVRGFAISCSVPFYEQSGAGQGAHRSVKGVARSTVLLSDFSQMIDSTGVGSSGQLFIVDRSGLKIYSSEGALITQGEAGSITGENFLDSANPRIRSLGLSMTLGASGMTELEMDGIPVYIAYAPIQTLGWSLGVAVSVQEVFASAFLIENQIWKITDSTKAGMDRYIFILAGFIAALLLLIFAGIAVLSIRFTHAITGPILALNKGVHEVAAGNLERAVTVTTGDELEELASSFNLMTSQLRRHIAEIARASAERQRINTELDIATQIQMGLLPNDFPPYRSRKNEFELYAEVHPAKEVGGDFYDFFFIDDDHFTMIIADVSGKGVPAALFMAITKTLIKNRLQSGEDPVLALEIINRQLCDNNITDMFVTVWLSVLEISTGRLIYVNAGHNQPLIKRGSQGFTFLVAPPDLVLAGMEDTRYHQRELFLKNGDILFLYTDGIIDAVNPMEALFGKERLRNFLNTADCENPHEIITRLYSHIEAYANGAEQADDITMLAVRICGEKPSPHYEPRLETITLKADDSCLDKMYAFLCVQLDSVSCPDHVHGQIELAAEEVFINIAHHAYTGEKGNVYMEIQLIPSPGKMTVLLAFSDNGRVFNPLEYRDPDISLALEDREPGGLGILIVKKTMDTIKYSHENGMNRLEFSKSWIKEEL